MRNKHSIFISSNTSFIEGHVLHTFIFENMEIPYHNCLFSDRVGKTKPHPDMFFKDVDYHIGDNPNTDGKCVLMGIKYYQVFNPLTLKNFIHEKNIFE